MSWFKVNDTLAMSKKVLRIPRAKRATAMGLWVLAGSWSASELTDGHVPDFMVDEWSDADTAADLVKVGLWDAVDDGYQFHDWADWQPTKEQVLADRAAAAERKRKSRERGLARMNSETAGHTPVTPVSHRDGRVTPPSVTGVVTPIPTRPDPTRPKSDGPRKRGTRLPDDWTPSDDLKRWTTENCPGLNGPATAAQFRDYWHSVAGAKGVKADWSATWRNWCRREHEGNNR